MNNLVIVESPTKIKTIKEFLNKNDQVVSTKGHIVGLVAKQGKNWLGIKIDENFEPIYEVLKGKTKIVNDIRKMAKKANKVLIATDPDREGEAIAKSIEVFAKIESKKVKRIRFNEITKTAILNAINNPTNIDENLVMAQQARRVLDRLLGFKLSSLLKNKIGSRSAGRVQSVALLLIVKKERERKGFTPIKHFHIEAFIKENIKIVYYGTEEGEKLLVDEKIKNELIKEIESKGFFLKKIEKRETQKNPPQPLKTSTLIQKASVHFGYSASQTMLIAQQLYEGIEIDGESKGLISYMRTDSTKLSSECKEKAKQYLIKNNYVVNKALNQTIKKSKFEQAAHEAIRPTDFNLTADKLVPLNNKQKNIYRLIWYYAIASLMEPAEIAIEKLIFNVKKHVFISTWKIVKKEGFLKLMKQLKMPNDLVFPNGENKIINNLKEGEYYFAKSMNVKEQETKPPKRYSIASLVKKLEELGVGRPSTYSSIIKTLKARFYINEENRSFIPTEQGFKTIKALEQHFNSVINESYTANIETNLDKVAKGKTTYLNIIEPFYNEFEKLIDKAKVEMAKLPPKEVGEDCPKCGKPLVERLGKYGPFIACSGFPKCKYIKKKELKKIGPCPKCDGFLVERYSKRGPFIGCSNYPKCKYSYKLEKKQV